jgi:hypothetical protein
MRRGDPIARYLGELTTCLEGSRRRRRRIVAEVGAHLRDAVDAQADLDPASAAERAIDRFGTVQQTAEAFRFTRAEREQSRRVRALIAAAAVLGSGVVVLALVLTTGHRGVSQQGQKRFGTRSQLLPARTSRFRPAGRAWATGTFAEPMHYRLTEARGCAPGWVRSGRARGALGAGVAVCAPVLAPDLPPRFVAGVCNGRLGIHVDARPTRARTLRIALANGVALTVPLSSVLAPASRVGGDLLLFASSPTRQPLRVDVLAANGRVLSSASGNAFKARLLGSARPFYPPQIVVAGALTAGGPLVIAVLELEALHTVCGACRPLRALRPSGRSVCARRSSHAAPLGPAA